MSEIGAMVHGNLGIEIPEERADAIARSVQAMLEAERAATASLPFEQEPSGFTREMESHD